MIDDLWFFSGKFMKKIPERANALQGFLLRSILPSLQDDANLYFFARFYDNFRDIFDHGFVSVDANIMSPRRNKSLAICFAASGDRERELFTIWCMTRVALHS